MAITRAHGKESPFEDLPKLPDKDLWYRMPEREKAGTPVQPVWYGDWIEYSRAIVRVGYYIEPKDMPAELLEQGIRSHIRNYMNRELKSTLPRTLIIDRERYLLNMRTDIEGLVTDQMVDLFIESAFLSMDKLKSLVYELRGDWADHTPAGDHPRALRTLWYVDIPNTSQVREIVTRKIGIAQSGYSSGWEDYEPGYFEHWATQKLYVVGYWDSIMRRSPIYVHPLDRTSPVQRTDFRFD